MTPTKSIWYRLGYALERARQAPPAASRSLKSLAERTTERKPAKRAKGSDAPSRPSSDDLIAAGVTAAVAKMISPRGKTGFIRLLKAGAAGAAAALAVEVLKPLLRGEGEIGHLDEEAGERMLAGVGQGLIYGAVVEPRVPGPALVKGALYGSAEYAVHPVGGLSHLMGGLAPQNKLPVIGAMLEGLDTHDRAYAEHVAFGIALAVLYGSSRSSNGIRMEVDDE